MLFDDRVDAKSSWAAKTYHEINEIAESDGSVVLVPVGSLEQHGHHMPTMTDTLLCDRVANAGVKRVENQIPILVLPPIWMGFSPHHMDFGGTVTLELKSMINMLEDISDAVLDNDFDAILFLNGHGGNSSLISSLTSTVGTNHPDVEVTGLTYWNLSKTMIREIRDSDSGGISHGGELETSLMMYLRPELIKKEEIKSNYRRQSYDLAPDDLVEEGGSLKVYRSMDPKEDTGVSGDPNFASAKKGEEIFEQLSEDLGELLLEIHDLNET